MEPDTVTGYIGQVLAECDVDEHASELLQELYQLALAELNS